MANDFRSLDSYFHQCYRPDYSLAILKRNCRISIFGVFDIQVLFGKVVSRGYEFEPGAYAEERFIRVAVPYAVGPPAQFVSLPDSLFNLHRVKWRLKELSNAVDSILENFEEGDSILLFRSNFSKICACFRELHGQTFFLPPESNHCYSVGPLCSVLQLKYPPLYTAKAADTVLELTEQILNKSRKGKRSITMVVGSKNTGKSMLTRVLANALLGKDRPPPYILDCDIGQPEMSPPGCVSLIKLTSPLLGVPMFQQRILLSDSYFYGRISLSDDSASYMALLKILLGRFFSDSLSSSALLINTCGWVEGKGASLLDEMMKLFDPDFVFSFITSSGPNYTVRQSAAKNAAKSVVFHVDAIEKPTHTISAPSILRSLRITAYMANLCPAPTVKSFAEAVPFAVLFRNVAVLVHSNEPFPANHVFAVLNCTLVALCVRNSINESQEDKRVFDDRDMPILLNPHEVEELSVIGYGFIRAIDIEQRIFFISTPLELPALQEVNVLARGLNIDLPQNFLVSQVRSAVPYVVRERSSSFHTELFKQLKIKSAFRWKRFLKMQNHLATKRSIFRS